MSVGLGDLCKCKCQHSQFTYSLLIKRNLQFFERALPEVGIEPTTVHLLDRHSSLLGIDVPDFFFREGVKETP